MLDQEQRLILAGMGDVDGTLRAVGADDDDTMDLANPADDPAYLAFYDRTSHLGNTGHALTDLVSAGHHDLARLAGARLAGAIAGQGQARSTLLRQAAGATLLMQAGGPDVAELRHRIRADVS